MRTRTRTKELLVVVVVADDLKRLEAVQCIVCDGVIEGNDGSGSGEIGMERWRVRSKREGSKEKRHE